MLPAALIAVSFGSSRAAYPDVEETLVKFAGKLSPFDQGALSVKERTNSANPFEEGSVEFGNFELGQSYARRLTRDGAQVHPSRRLKVRAG